MTRVALIKGHECSRLAGGGNKWWHRADCSVCRARRIGKTWPTRPTDNPGAFLSGVADLLLRIAEDREWTNEECFSARVWLLDVRDALIEGRL